MSSHFNYDIDEKNMRVKLKGMELPYTEEAWSSFENYCDNTKSTYKTGSLPKFNLNLNRNIILPIVFGAGIILFSMLLFNFVSIKNKPADNKVAKVVQPKADPPQPKKIIAQPVLKDTAKVVVAEKQDTTRLKAEVIVPPTPTVAAVVTPTVQNNPQLPVWTVIESGDIYESPNIASKVIGNASLNKSFSALEETNYFIKVSFGQNNQTGFFRKAFLRKKGTENTNLTFAGGAEPKKKKVRKAEVLESIQTPAMLPSGSEEKEPELK